MLRTLRSPRDTGVWTGGGTGEGTTEPRGTETAGGAWAHPPGRLDPVGVGLDPRTATSGHRAEIWGGY